MTRVAKSSSGNGSSPVANKLPTFDITTESGTLELLRALHRSGVRQKDKNELRDQLFEYVQKPGTGKTALVNAFKEVGFDLVEGGEVSVEEVQDTPNTSVSRSGFGQSRAVPSFAPASVRTQSAAAPELKPTEEPQSAPEPVQEAVVEEVSLDEPKAEEVAEAVPAESEAKVEEVAEPEPEQKATEEATAESVVEEPQPVPETEVMTQDEALAPAPEVVETKTQVSAPEPTPTPEATGTTGGDPMERIKEIKRIINNKVGNPITLIDTDNQVGREYMNALLAAMKAVNGGTPDEVGSAMARLENAYNEALRVIQTIPQPSSVTDKFVDASQATNIKPVADGYAAAQANTLAEPEVRTPEVKETPQAVAAPTPASEPVTVPTPASTPEPEIPKAAPAASKPESVAQQQFSPTSVKLPVTSAELATEKTVADPVVVKAAAPTPAPAPTPVPEAEVPSVPTQSEVPPAVPMAPVAASAAVKPVVDPGTPSYVAPGMPTPPPLPDDAEQAVTLSSVSPATSPAQVPSAPAAPVTPPTSAQAPTEAVAADQKRLMSVAKEEQLQKLMQQNRLEELEQQQQQDEVTRASTDPLMLPEVTAGLQQLLSEWGLFKSSGFFGTGPGGIDHPLYKKIAPLTLSAVIAGRFEGATPQVKQSITEYMNGWRYEEGIVHEHSETFEHYLRRVINHILSKKQES